MLTIFYLEIYQALFIHHFKNHVPHGSAILALDHLFKTLCQSVVEAVAFRVFYIER